MMHTYGCNLASEEIVFRDGLTTAHAANGASLEQLTPGEEILACLDRRQGGGEWLLEVNGTVAGKGRILFHYNRPFGDIYMEVSERCALRSEERCVAPDPFASRLCSLRAYCERLDWCGVVHQRGSSLVLEELEQGDVMGV